MKIVVLTGSPHKSGTTAALTEQFLLGAAEAGHEVFRFDAAQKDVHPCIACEHCHTTDQGCVFSDGMAELNPHLMTADAIVLVSPIYYFGLSAQLKTVIDRFYANNAALKAPKKAALILAMADKPVETADGAVLSYQRMVQYLGWEDVGTVLATGCATASDLEQTPFPIQAYKLGKALDSRAV